jgi:hypothetical protein
MAASVDQPVIGILQRFDWPCDMISMNAKHSDVKAYCAEMAGRLREALDAEVVFVYEFRVCLCQKPMGLSILPALSGLNEADPRIPQFRAQSLGFRQAIVDRNPQSNLTMAEIFSGNLAQVIHTGAYNPFIHGRWNTIRKGCV